MSDLERYHRTEEDENKDITLTEGEEVDLVVKGYTDIGIKVLINEKYIGMLYKDELFRVLNAGDRVKGYVKKIRGDKKIDVTLRKGGFEDIEEAKEIVLRKLRANDGFLPLGDSSDPEVIKKHLHMSKKTFKKAIGNLYKEGVIELKPDGIKLQRTQDKIKRMGSFKF